MPPKTVLQLGAGQYLAHSISLLRESGFRVYAVDRNPDAPGLALSDGYAPIDIIDANGVTDYAREIGAHVILAVNEAGVLAAAEASERLGLINLSPKVAVRCLDKGLMRDCWKEAGLPQPDYRVVQTTKEISTVAAELGYPIILKPAMHWGGRGVSLVGDESELSGGVDFAKKHCRNRRYIVEKFVSGTEMTVEGLVQQGRPQILAKSDKEPQVHPRYRVAMSINYPARFDPWQLDLADQVVTGAVRALGIENGAFHGECMINEKGVYLLELGARGGGDYIFSRIVEAVSGICMPRALVRILLNERPDIRPRYQRGACWRFFVPPDGVFREVLDLDEARNLPGILDMGFDMAPGTVAAPIKGDADRPGYVVAAGTTREEAIANADRAIARVRFVMGQA